VQPSRAGLMGTEASTRNQADDRAWSRGVVIVSWRLPIVGIASKNVPGECLGICCNE